MTRSRTATVVLTADIRALTVALRRIRRVIDRGAFSTRMLSWSLRNSPVRDVERYGLALATRYVREGRTDLAVETLDWLGRWIEEYPAPRSTGARLREQYREAYALAAT